MHNPALASSLTLFRRGLLAFLLLGATAQASAIEVTSARSPFELGRNDQRH